MKGPGVSLVDKLPVGMSAFLITQPESKSGHSGHYAIRTVTSITEITRYNQEKWHMQICAFENKGLGPATWHSNLSLWLQGQHPIWEPGAFKVRTFRTCASTVHHGIGTTIPVMGYNFILLYQIYYSWRQWKRQAWHFCNMTEHSDA